MDELFPVKIQDTDMTIKMGRGMDELNVVILVPKTDKRSNANDVSLGRLLEARIKDPELAKSMIGYFSGKCAANLHKLCLR